MNNIHKISAIHTISLKTDCNLKHKLSTICVYLNFWVGIGEVITQIKGIVYLHLVDHCIHCCILWWGKQIIMVAVLFQMIECKT